MIRAILGGQTAPAGCGVTAFSPLTQCTEFDGANERCLASNYTSNLAFDYTDPFTLGAWIKHAATPTATEPLTSAYYYAAARGWNWGLGAGGSIFTILRESNSIYVSAGVNPPFNVDILDGDWHLIVCTYDGSASGAGFDFYLDAILETNNKNVVDQGTPTTVPYDANNKFSIASRGNGPDYYGGRMCHPFVLSKKLDAAGVSCLYSLSKPIDLPTHPDIAAADIEQWVRLGEGDTVGTNTVITLAGGASNLSTFNMEAGDFQIADTPP